MRVVTTRDELARARGDLGTVGFVPTMGYLHDGHLSLVRAARRANDSVVVSIFVNPTQFDPGEDLDSYPRDLDRDLAMLEAEGVDLVWTPRVEDVYPPGSSTRVTVGGVTDVLEGARRPGHFDGVATVCTILFRAVRPTRAYFGQKDAQQTVVIRRLVRDLALGLEVCVEPIRREPDGLAMSSRNTYLSTAERAVAPVLHRALLAAQEAYAAGHRQASDLLEAAHAVLATEPAVAVEYVSLADPDTLAELDEVDPGRGPLVSLAARLGRTRLIDSLVLAPTAADLRDSSRSSGQNPKICDPREPAPADADLG
ncbi:pantoate--beta-alanine ligase [Arsenicicoccus sp. oral taxon 190]|uniref:pantoate--beta-alanine ligase n=1 Tax=Arsenicicoccus sp. oral taxon 190 TaxID=1658671 RepID=UPI0009E5BC27|nr:pantoate--beta-alanine ligase [Arsenicicoccus sp. oral taxon 190]